MPTPSMPAPRLGAGVLIALLASPGFAHGIVGDRFFPATLVTDDPAVADELTLPQVSVTRTPDDPSVTETDISGEWDKRITSDFGFAIAADWTNLATPSGNVAGFQDLDTTFKYHLASNVPHELMLSVGLEVDWGKGAQRVGADRFTTLTPNFYFGKGAGDLPDSLAWARPLAVTGVIGYDVPTKSGETQNLETGLAFEYSLRYLASHVRDIGLPAFLNQMTPLVELQLTTPTARGAGAPTTGTVNPGVIWSGQHIQLGIEATAPINRASGHAVGMIFQTHWFVDDMFPHSLGRPIW